MAYSVHYVIPSLGSPTAGCLSPAETSDEVLLLVAHALKFFKVGERIIIEKEEPDEEI